MWTPLLILGLVATEPEPLRGAFSEAGLGAPESPTYDPSPVGGATERTFPDWRWQLPSKRDSVRVVANDTIGNGSNWIVVSEHPALRRDSLATVDVVVHPLLTALMWPVDHVVRPTMGLVFKPLRAAIRYGEETNLVDRGTSFIHPTGKESSWLYPTAVLDGSTASRWGLTFVDRDFFCPGWRLQLGGAMSVAADGYVSAWTQTPPTGPFQQRLKWGGSYSFSREYSLRVPDLKPISDNTLQGATSERRLITELVLNTPGPIPGASWDVSYHLAGRKEAAPRRYDAEFKDIGSIEWLGYGDPEKDRGLRGREIDHTISLAGGWSDQENPGSPTKGGRVNTRMWVSLSDGGGGLAGFDVQGTRYFLLGSERYVYKKGDLEPYLELDPMQIIKMLDPSTLRQRLTQRKILAFYFRMSRVWELDASNHPASFFLFPTIGGDAPARAYSGRYLMGRSLIGGTIEYRWPIWRYIDGTSFTELAWAAPDWWRPTLERLAPSIGGGIRVRMPRMFLFRVQAAFGVAGAQLIATTDAEF
jgi:hypothetical protein